VLNENAPRVAYLEEISKHRLKLPLYDLEPKTENCWIAPNSTLGINIIFISVFSWRSTY
jgi:hypothetical protein